MPQPAIACRDLVVRYGSLVAVDHLSIRAQHRKVLALLGPNGAGKTSTVEALEGYRHPSTGEIRVLGIDPTTEHRRLVAHIGVMLQRGGVYPTMTPRRILRLFSHYYADPEDPEALLGLLGLIDVAGTPWRRLSGGEQQRLALALALVGRPDVLFLDEPTAGVDPEGRLSIRAVIAAQRERGTCIVLTTHELTEAERLADEVVILTNGRIAAHGTVAELAALGGEGGIEFKATHDLDLEELARLLEVESSSVVDEGAGRYAVKAPPTPARLAALAGWLTERGLPVADLSAGRRSLEDVYLEVTRAEATARSEVAERDEQTSHRAEEGGGRGDRDCGARDPQNGGIHDSATGVLTGAGAASGLRRLAAQAGAEISMTLRRGESLLVTLGIPVVLLVFFAQVHLLPVGTSHPVAFLAPGVMALAIMGTALVNLSIATGFERGYGVLKRLGSTPLGRRALLGAKIAAVLVVEVLQIVLLAAVALGLGWHLDAGGIAAALGVILLATAAFAGIGLLLAGVLRPEVNLAASNGLWLLLLLVSGMLAPLSKLPGWLGTLSKALPAAALAQALHYSLTLGLSVPTWSWIVLLCWAALAPLAAAATFRWE